jgi:tRNA isopentenyl-2-thiomethyl-A-37 hydroxylase MiaE
MTEPTARDRERARGLRVALLQFIEPFQFKLLVAADGKTEEPHDRIDTAIARALAEARAEERVVCISAALDYMKRAGIDEHAEKFLVAIRQRPMRKESAG